MREEPPLLTLPRAKPLTRLPRLPRLPTGEPGREATAEPVEIMLLLEPKKFLELLRRPNKCQKRPTIRAKETYYVRTFESLTSKLARALGIRLVRLLLAYRRALMAFRCLCVRVCVCVCVCVFVCVVAASKFINISFVSLFVL